MDLIPSKYSILFGAIAISFFLYGALIQAVIMSVFTVLCWGETD